MNTYQLIRNWAIDKQLFNHHKQRRKIIEEWGEVNGAYLKQNEAEIINEIGDLIVTLTIHLFQRDKELIEDYILDDLTDYKFNQWDVLEMMESIDLSLIEYLSGVKPINEPLLFIQLFCNHYNTTIDQCAQLAYEKIKNRKGVSVNDTFIKF